MKKKMQTTIGLVVFVVLLISKMALGEITCPSYQETPFCSCFVLDDQLHVQCSGNDIHTLKKSLIGLNGPVKSFSVYDLDSRASILPNDLTDNVTSPILHFSLSHSSLEDLSEGSLRGLSKSLESLAVISSRLRHIPQSTLSTLRRLKLLDFEGNNIQELLSYSFHNILLQKVNLKGNQLENVSEHAFWGLEETLMEIDMSENKLKTFPFVPFQRLRMLSSLNLAWNEINDLSVLAQQTQLTISIKEINRTGPGLSMDWPLLKYLNLNSNYLRRLEPNTFGLMGNLRSLSIHLNSIETVDEDAFLHLTYLESIDMSHNKLQYLKSRIFKHTPNILTIDISNNHLHEFDHELFNDLKDLRELFLNGNNLLQLSSSTFIGSNHIEILYLQQNSLKFMESGIFNPLKNLSELRLSENFLKNIPQDLFLLSEKMRSLSLDGNLLAKIVPGTFHNCKKLRELRLQNNEIGIIPSGVLDVLPQLEELHLENNQLNSIVGLDSLKDLRHISLSRNHIERLSKETLPGTALSSLSLGHNWIRMIDDGAFSNQSTLSLLFLGNNRLGWLGAKTFLGLKSLERLYLQRNNITSVHTDCFSSSTRALRYLDLSYNALKVIPIRLFNGLSYLEEINLSNNQIISLEEGSLSNLQSLRIIDLSSNQLIRIDYLQVFRSSGLQILKICCNSLEEITGLGHSNIGLKELDIRENHLSGIELSSMKLGFLEVLQVSSNNLTDLDESTFTGFPSLNFLEADKCHITSLPNDIFRQNPHLAVIRLSENSLTWIPDTIFGYGSSSTSESGNGESISVGSKSVPSSLRELHLRHNKLRNFPYKLLSNASFLTALSLAGNRINSLELGRIRLPSLKQFDMNENRLSKITGSLSKSMPNLEVVDFGENNIGLVTDDFLRNISLAQINFGGNKLQKIPFAFSDIFITTPHVLNMSGNPLINFYTENHPGANFSVMDLYLSDMNVSFLTNEEFLMYPKLHRLVIRRNPIKAIPSRAFSPLTNLNLLDLSENDIENIKEDSFNGLVQLKSLNLSHNRIKSLSTFHVHLSGLQDLDLSYNQLSRLQIDIFHHLLSLITLRLRGNWLTNLPSELFFPLRRLSVLDISHNFIETIPRSVLQQLETRITVLQLQENPLSCDCDSKDFWEWLQAHPKITSTTKIGQLGNGRPNNFICEKPEDLRGKFMMDSDIPSYCSAPAILKLAIQDVRPSSAVVSWQGRNNSGMQGYVIAYHALNHNDVVRTRPLPATSRFYLLPDLQSDTPYLICVLGYSNEETVNFTTSALTTRSAETLLRDSPISKCTQVRTLGYDDAEIASVFQRRLGVLVGAGVGIVVFFILITTLACIKVRKRRHIRQQTQNSNNGNGKSHDHHNHPGLHPQGLEGVLTAHTQPNIVGGTLGRSAYNNHHNHNHHTHTHYTTLTRNGGSGALIGNGTGGTGTLTSTSATSPRPDFLTYRHYTLAPETGIHPSQMNANCSDLETL